MNKYLTFIFLLVVLAAPNVVHSQTENATNATLVPDPPTGGDPATLPVSKDTEHTYAPTGAKDAATKQPDHTYAHTYKPTSGNDTGTASPTEAKSGAAAVAVRAVVSIAGLFFLSLLW